MSRLLSADFAKLRKNRFFWICTAGMFLFGAFMMISHYVAMTRHGEDAHLTNVLFIYSIVSTILIPAFTSLFIGTEYSDGTVRNKLVIGHTRGSIYLSNLIVCSAAGIIFCLAYVAAVLLFGIPLTGLDNGSSLLFLFLISLGTALAATSLCTVTAMVCQSRSSTAVINILIACFMLVVSIIIINKLSQPETFPDVSYDTATGQLTYSGKEIENPDYLEGGKREAYQFFNDLLPTGQAFNIAQGGGVVVKPELLPAYSACIIVISTAAGIYVFRRKDIK